jgi:putative membrane protein
MKLVSLAAAAVALAFTATAPQAAEALNDAQIAHIAYTAGVLDVDAARQALEKSKDPEVRAFAETMVRDHEAVNRQALALVEKLGVTPQPNDLSKSLGDAAATKLASHEALSGGAFDRAYVANETAYHAQVNEALRTTLIPGATNPELRTLLESGLALFSEHQKHAERLSATLR